MNNIFDASRTFADNIYTIHHISIYKFGKTLKGQQLIKRLNLKDSASLSKYLMFDMNKLSTIERNVLTKVFPFYIWTRKNVEFHIRNFAKNSKRYFRLLNFIDGIEESNIFDKDEKLTYDINGIPVYRDSNGKITYLKIDNPFKSALETLSGKQLLNSLNPLFKWPIEQILGINLYTTKAKEDWKYLPFGLDNIWKIPKYLFQTLFDRDNLDKTLVSNIGIIGNRFVNMIKFMGNWFTIGDPDFNPALFFPSLFTEYDTQKIMLNNRLNEANKLNEYINNLRSSGKYVPNISDILPNRLGYVKPKYRTINPKYRGISSNKLITPTYQKNYKS